MAARSRGIIPALAGNTTRGSSQKTASRDHPRSRGEYHVAVSHHIPPNGSSPLSRGIRVSRKNHLRCDRIIPALAGNTSRRTAITPSTADHPRSRGEYSVASSNRDRDVGSSPLSRGIRRLGCSQDRGQGIIPALAGNTGAPHPGRTPGEDHPRSRGEYFMLRPPRGQLLGSSPLSRGILAAEWTQYHPGRIIPALAGNTLVDKGFYQLDLSDLGNPLLARLRFSKSLAPRLRRPPSWRRESSGSSLEGPGRTIRVSPS